MCEVVVPGCYCVVSEGPRFDVTAVKLLLLSADTARLVQVRFDIIFGGMNICAWLGTMIKAPLQHVDNISTGNKINKGLNIKKIRCRINKWVSLCSICVGVFFYVEHVAVIT